MGKGGRTRTIPFSAPATEALGDSEGPWARSAILDGDRPPGSISRFGMHHRERESGGTRRRWFPPSRGSEPAVSSDRAQADTIDEHPRSVRRQWKLPPQRQWKL